MAEERTFFESQPSSTGGSPSGAVHDPSLAFPYLFDNRVSDPYVDRIDHRTNASGSSDSGGSDSDLGDGSSDYGDGSQSNDYIVNLEQQITNLEQQVIDSGADTNFILDYIAAQQSGSGSFFFEKRGTFDDPGHGSSTSRVTLMGVIVGGVIKVRCSSEITITGDPRITSISASASVLRMYQYPGSSGGTWNNMTDLSCSHNISRGSGYTSGTYTEVDLLQEVIDPAFVFSVWGNFTATDDSGNWEASLGGGGPMVVE